MWYSTAGSPNPRHVFDTTGIDSPPFIQADLDRILRESEAAIPVTIKVSSIGAAFAFYILLKLGVAFQCLSPETFVVPKSALENLRQVGVAFEQV